MPLRSPRFRDNQRLQRAAENSPALKQPERGQAVRLLQQALIDCGISLPKSTARYGTPDGIYGLETQKGVAAFQKNHHIKTIDGRAGHDTLYALDKLFPMPVPPLPPLPGFTPDGKLYYRVPGLIHGVKQDQGMSCWATCFTMMLSWKESMCLTIEAAVRRLGEPFIAYYLTNHGLPIEQNLEFARRGNLKGEPLVNLSPEGLLDMLQRSGLLWKGYAWMAFNKGKQVLGRHIILVYGIQGDASGDGTQVFYLDPADGLSHAMTFSKFAADTEFDFNLLFSPWLNNMPVKAYWGDKDLGKWTQMVHF